MAKKKIIRYEVESSTAAKALYQAGKDYLPKIQLTFTTHEGEILEIELGYMDAANFIDQAAAAYNALMRPLKTSRGTSN